MAATAAAPAVTPAELEAYNRGERVERICAWDNGRIVVRLTGAICPVDEAIAEAVRAHQATIPHQFARRRRGIVDVDPPPAVNLRVLVPR